MKLSEFFTEKTNIDTSSQISVSQYAKTADINRQIHALIPGQTIQGEVIGRNGSEIQLRLAEDMLLNARVDQNISLEMGKLITFEVKNNGAALTLSPLFTNVAADVNVLKALDMAALPVNDETVDMTEQLMQAGFPVNKASLQQVYREISAFPQSEVSDIVNLHRLEMPVTEENVEQVMSYRNLSYQLSDALDEVLNLLPGAAEELLEQGDAAGAEKLYQQLLSIVGEGENPKGTAAQSAPLTAGEPGAEISSPGTIPAEELPAEGIPVEENRTQEMQTKEMPVGEDAGRQTVTEGAGQAVKETPDSLSGAQNRTEPLPGDVSGQQFAGQTEASPKPPETSAGQRLMPADRQSWELLTDQLKGQWTISPEDVEDREKVSELYRRLDRQMDALSRVLEENGQTSGAAYKAVSSVSQNIDFLQQLNQMFTYVQLPLRLQQGQANGDLYVYTNKRSLASGDGKISAFLHLDMEHLGPVDVYVALQDNKVSTKFSVRDDDMLDFLEEHMDILTKRLKKRGYDCEFSLKVRDDEKEAEEKDGGLWPVLQQETGIPLSRYSFDVRT